MTRSLALLLVGIVAMPIGSAISRDLSPDEKKLVSAEVSHDFKDPSSAQFRWLPLPDGPPTDHLQPYCGMVNGKNSFGAYVGFSPFHVFFAIKKGKAFLLGPTGGDVGEPGDWKSTFLLKECRTERFDLRLAR